MLCLVSAQSILESVFLLSMHLSVRGYFSWCVCVCVWRRRTLLLHSWLHRLYSNQSWWQKLSLWCVCVSCVHASVGLYLCVYVCKCFWVFVSVCDYLLRIVCEPQLLLKTSHYLNDLKPLTLSQTLNWTLCLLIKIQSVNGDRCQQYIKPISCRLQALQSQELVFN